MRPALPCLLAILALIGFFHVEATAEPATTAVPRLVGLRVHEAERKLADAGLTARLLGKPDGEGVRIVTAQRPAQGDRARVGAQVRVTYRWSSFGDPPPGAPGRRQAPQVRVPRLTGLRLREAVRRLERVGLGADAIGPTAGRGGRALVVGQHPAAGEVVTRRATIRITWRYAR